MCDGSMSFSAADSVLEAERCLLAALDELRAAKARFGLLQYDRSLATAQRDCAALAATRLGNLFAGVEITLTDVAPLCHAAGDVTHLADERYAPAR